MTDPAMVKSGYDREPGDFYATPEWCTEVLLRHVEFDGPVWEPAAGDGAMWRVLRGTITSHVLASDIAPHGAGGYGVDKFDFFDVPPWSHRVVEHVITNPPYNLAREFIERALVVTGPSMGKVAMLLRNEYDCAKTRRHLFGECPQFALKIVLTKRPVWFPDREKKASPRHNFAWYVWDWKHTGPAEIRYDR